MQRPTYEDEDVLVQILESVLQPIQKLGSIHSIPIESPKMDPYLCMFRAHRHSFSNLFVNDDINSDALLGLSLQDSVKAPFRVERRRTSEIEFRGEPPVKDEDVVFGVLKNLGECPEVVYR